MKKFIKIPSDYFKGMKYDIKVKVQVPTILCSCGKTVLDTPTNRLLQNE